MIQIVTKSGTIKNTDTLGSLTPLVDDIFVVVFIDYQNYDLHEISRILNLDLKIFDQESDLETSSHLIETDSQYSIHLTIPVVKNKEDWQEKSYFIVGNENFMAIFEEEEIGHRYFNTDTFLKLLLKNKQLKTSDALGLKISMASDYFSDLTELMVKRTKALAAEVLQSSKFSEKELDYITRLNFHNMLIKESQNEFQRLCNYFKNSSWEQKFKLHKIIDHELHELTAISEYIQFNFDRLNDLRENISNKINVEQNYIFKYLTIVTLCLALPTLIAGIYGMNFINMPELQFQYGYPLVLLVMLVSIIVPFVYFKRKKWF